MKKKAPRKKKAPPQNGPLRPPLRQPAIETGHLSMADTEKAVLRVGKLAGRRRGFPEMDFSRQRP